MNVMSKRMAARKRALRAVQAVSIGGVAFASQACGSETSSSGGEEDVTNVDVAVSADAELDVPEQDISVDAAEDIGQDTEADAAPDTELDATEPDVVPDVEEDAAEDVRVDVGEDATTDTTPQDVAPDAPEDVASDVREDIAVDTSPDAESDTESDVAEDVVADSDTGGDSCEPEEDNVCPDNCTQDNDWDCCRRFADESGLPCFYDPSFGCNCAAVGPFNPPTMPGRSVMASS